MKVVLERYHGLSNDYVVFDPNKNELELTPGNVKMICDRNAGLGADGVLEGPVIKEDGMHVKVWNPDGSESETSGNGVRIFAKYLKDAGYIQKKNFKLYTRYGEAAVTFLNEDGSRLRVSMGKISFWSDEIPVTGEKREVINEDMVFGRTLYPVTCVSVGNPHCVIPMREISKNIVCKIGDYSECAKYFPHRINTQIMKVIDKENIALVQIRQHRHQIARLLYRGAGGYAHVDAHLICDDTRKRRFAKSRGAMQENVVKRLSAHFCGVDEHGQIRLCLLLTYIFSQCFRSQRALSAVLRQACRGSYDLIIYIVREIDAHFVFSITLPSASEQS